jgi:hypothetical protein
MSNESPTHKIGEDFDIKEYLEINTASANRSRWLTLVLIVATVLIFIGFYNSLKISWASYRLRQLKSFENLPENNFQDKQKNKPLLDAYFGSNDFSNNEAGVYKYEGYGLKKFACKFQSDNFQGNVEISRYIYNVLNARTKELLQKECLPGSLEQAPSGYFFEAVQGDLNRILKDRFLYSKERFPCAKNSDGIEDCENENNRKPETNNLLAATGKLDSILNIKEKDLIRMNRLLLEETYKGEILESSNLIPDEEELLAKEIPFRLAYDDNVVFIKIPVLGFSIDVNDLGFIGGISIFIILYLLRFSLSREIKNLNLSFKEAFYHEKICPFYHSLAMRQVLIVPPMEGEIRNKKLAMTAKFIYFLPVIIICLGVSYDYYSVFHYHLFSWDTVKWQLFSQIFPCILLVLYISLRCLERQFHIDKIWDHFYYIHRENLSTLKLKYAAELEKRNQGEDSPNKKLIEIYEYHFVNPSGKNPFWFVTLYLIGVYKLRNFGKLLVSFFPTKREENKPEDKEEN